MIILVSTFRFPYSRFCRPTDRKKRHLPFSLVRTWMHVNLSRLRTRRNIVCNFSKSYFIMHGLTPDHASIRHQHRLESYRGFFDNSSFFLFFFFSLFLPLSFLLLSFLIYFLFIFVEYTNNTYPIPVNKIHNVHYSPFFASIAES